MVHLSQLRPATREGVAGLPASRRRLRALGVAMVAAIAASMIVGVAAAAPARAAVTDPCGTGSNAIVCENSKPGTPESQWDIDGAGDATIQGFATDISVNAGSTIGFKVKTDASKYSIRIFRTGYYQGNGARLIATIAPSAALPQTQPQCVSDVSTQLYDCGNWALSASWAVPATAVSGVYVADLTRTDTGGTSQILFIVRNDASHSQVVFQTSDPTWEAYNSYGGADFYQGAAVGRAYKISYNRPLMTRDGSTNHDNYFSAEYPAVRFLEQNGYDVSYIAGVDTDRYGSLLTNHNVFLSVGHDEYWSTGQRANVEAARDKGLNLQFLSGNEVYWHTRYESSSVDPSGGGYRTLVSYKETWSNAKIDPSTTWTGTWRDPRFAPPSAGAGRPENTLTGTMYMSNSDDLPVTVSSTEGKLRIWRNTSLATMAAGTSQALAPHTIGYESDEDVDNGMRPAGLIDMSTTVGSTPQYLRDFGSVVTPGTTTHHITLYRAPSGARVFSAGSIQWTWGLDQDHDGNGAAADPRMQQAQVNLLADMGAQPLTIMSGLVKTTASTDTTAPTVTVTTPAANASIANGASVTVTGTASDVGGVVAGVEVSTDGGTTWHPARGTTNWTYTYVQHGQGAQRILVRGIDDSGNYPSTPTTVTVQSTGAATVFGATVPTTPDAGDPSSVELGLRFTPAANGYVQGVRFYKSAGNTGVHTGSLWDATGARLASVTFTGETASGWQKATFSSPVPVVAGQQYTVSYTAPSGHYAGDSYYWAYSAQASPPLTVDGSYAAPSPGVYGDPGTYPAKDYQRTNYWVDPVFDTVDSTPPSVASQWPLPGSTGVAAATTISAALTGGINDATVGLTVKSVQGSLVAGTSAYDSTRHVITFTPAAALAAGASYTATVTAQGQTGTPLSTGGTWTFTVAAAGTETGCPCTIFPDSTLPTTLQVSDGTGVTLGSKFIPSVSGSIVGLRFYKGPGNVGQHIATLWNASGTKLAQVTFSNESASGWQTAYFTSAVALTAGTTYVVSYVSTTGNYSVTPGRFTNDYVSGALTVPAQGGVFTYGSGMPTSTTSTDYSVDVVFMRSTAAPVVPLTVTSHAPGSDAAAVAPTAPITATLSADPGSTIPTLSVASSGSAVAGTSSYDAASRTITFTPGAPLAWSTQYSVTVSSGSTALGGGTWSFTTAAQAPPGASYHLIDDTPATASNSDSGAVELGMSFTASQAGSVTGVRFYKGTGNTGTHTGSLWSSTGQRLATVTFANETATGWQTATFATPVALTPGQHYVVSYYAPNGHYASTSGYFSAMHSSGPLSADTVQNGRYLYGAGGQMPTGSWNASNYFVDVLFTTAGSAAPVTVASTSPAADATAVPTSATVTATMSAESSAGQPTIAVTGPSGAVAGSVTNDPVGHTVTFAPTAPLATSTTYTATVSIAGGTVTGGSWSFTTAAASAPDAGFHLAAPTPAVAAEDDTGSVELGMAFSSSAAGSVTAIRFYKGSGNTGTHTGSLWLPDGTRVAQVTFTGETAGGWQTATLATPYVVVPGQTYIVSYHAPNGHYASTSGYFGTTRTSGPLTADAVNGRYNYGSTPALPDGSWGATDYGVDVTFVPSTSSTPSTPPTTPSTPPATPSVTVGTTNPAQGTTDVAPTLTVTAAVTGSGASGTSLVVTAPGGATVDGASTYSATDGTVSFTPTTPFGWSTAYTATVMAGGAAVAGGTWSFTTTAAPTQVTGDSIFALDATPQNAAWNDPTDVQVAVRFSTDVAGTVTAVRFYKGDTNTGTHTGYLWGPDKGLLATVSFTNETASGWQVAQFSQPVSILPGQEYRVGLRSTTGNYAVDLNGLANGLTSGHITVPAQGAAYSSGSAYPDALSNHNYWVDLLFAPQTPGS
ncbi:DUF4082 domain-containing protein [Pseudolysinimonas sp.]|uniref:DUF4082 domain-containing protein n=1 Tax=Pseudolysinimonas sp. TaxID=2680009 RepID=UPI003F7EEE90